MNHPHIIGLTGSGKDTVADLLVIHAGFTKMAFADTLNAEVADAFAVDLEFLTRLETKEHPMSCLAMSRCLSDSFVGRMMRVHNQAGTPFNMDAPHNPAQMLRWWHTDYRCAAQPDYWVSKTRNRISYLLRERLASRIVVMDCQFANEVEMICASFGGQLWHIHEDGAGDVLGNHVSETTGSEFRAGVILNNSHTVGHLQERVLEALWTQTAGLAPGSLHVRIAQAAPLEQLAAQ